MELAELYREIQGLDAEVLAISSNDLSGAQTIAKRLGIPFPVLYDPELLAIMGYGARGGGAKYATPTTFVIDKSGVIRWKYGGARYDRPETSVVMNKIRAIAN